MVATKIMLLRLIRSRHLAQVLATGFVALGALHCFAAYLTEQDFDIVGLPQQQYDINGSFSHGQLTRINFEGSVGYVIEPNGIATARREWVWITPLWLSLPSAYGNYFVDYYVENLLDEGYHVVGFDVGTSLGSPKASDLYAQFQDYVIGQFNLAPKARMLAVSNGGLITYGYAFRNPGKIDRIAAIYPAVDFTSWPQLHLVVGPSAITPAGLAYELTPAQMQAQITQYNPIDNLAPLAFSGVPLWHVHGDSDTTVPIGPNSLEAVERYTALGGDIELKVVPGGIHGGMQFFTDPDLLNFLMTPSVANLPGDFNGDSVVDTADYVVWRNYLGTTYHLSRNGDEDAASSGIVDEADYLMWEKNFGTSSTASAAEATQVPEPTSFVQLLLVGSFVSANRRKEARESKG